MNVKTNLYKKNSSEQLPKQLLPAAIIHNLVNLKLSA